ncbi:Inner membrane protein YqcE [Pseudobythopirellula maris]|uniref:Inner membrane protein YqcE n=1 Tax=Pseudobythopirellula maris TaxID=2527991 RepID=A0A5C5ZTR8_9BACT|nr:Inner membrane protein YqcE [Pseudobythopirellula maris]
MPFLVPRLFRPTMLEVFGLSNLDLGLAFSAYGLVAMAAYLGGGPLADLLSPRKLLAVALVTTSLGGAMLWSVPALATLKMLYAYWGFTTIALFWSALMRATREWGGAASQGTAFGLLDGGRGLLAALVGTAAVACFGWALGGDPASATPERQAAALQAVVVLFSVLVALAGLFVYFALPKHPAECEAEDAAHALGGLWQAARMPRVWLQALIIVCAYVGYKATDDFSLYARDVLGLGEVKAAGVGAISLWVRPVAAIGAGLLADRFGAARMTAISFLLLLVGGLVLAGVGVESGGFSASLRTAFLATVVGVSLGIYALRGLYFAIMQEGRVPLAYTGSAVGLVSVVGYTPDVFMGPLMGKLLDNNPGAEGHQQVFLVMAGFAAVGLAASLVYAWSLRRESRRDV